MATTEEQILSILNNSLTGGELPLLSELTGTEFNIIYNPTTNRVERVLVESSGGTIIIDNNQFAFVKGFTGSVKNTSVTLEANDYIINGTIRNNSVNLYIDKAKYLGGDVTDMGVYSPSSSEFVGGNYVFLEYSEI